MLVNTQKHEPGERLKVNNHVMFHGDTSQTGFVKGCMAQAVSRRSLIAKARVCARVGPCQICGERSGTGTDVSPSSLVPLSISFHHDTPYLYITWGINSRPFGCRSLEM
jgi:hypothetical protein